MAGSDC